MSVAEDSVAGDIRHSSAPPVDLSRVTYHYRLPVYIACAVLALAVNRFLGKEMAWDVLSYHLYSGFSALHDRFAQDYFAAGIQTYLNPYAYVPFYVLATSGLSALEVGSLLALLHSIILCLTFELALVAFSSGTRAQRAGMAACAVAMAAINPILLQQLGTSFTDVTTGELVLAGWLLLATTVRSPSAMRVVLAAGLLGTASALKMTNAVHALSAATVLIMIQQPTLSRIRHLATYGTALCVSFAIVAAPWSYRLATSFGNPFFPLLNNVFRSPEFPTEPLRLFRFIPSSLTEALLRPLAMLNPVPMVHEEFSSPDLRYAVLLILVAVLLVQWLLKRYQRGRTSPTGNSAVDIRVLTALGCGFAVDWGLWLTASGNGRYFVPLSCIAAVLVVGTLFLVFAERPKARNYALAVIFATQLVQLCMGAELRWNGVAWDEGPWFGVQVPQRLASEHALYLSMGPESNSFVAPYLAPDAGLINFAGAYPLGVRGANGAKVAELIRRYAPHLRVLARGEYLYPDSERRSPGVSEVNDAVRRLGLRVDSSDCATITVRGLPPGLEIRIVSSRPAEKPTLTRTEGGSAATTFLIACALVPDHADHSVEFARNRAAALVLDRLEDACPQLFQPRRPPTDDRGTLSRRYYFNSDLIAWVSHDEVKFIDTMVDDGIVRLGRESEWLRAPQKVSCNRHGGHYFARLTGPAPAN